MRLQQTASVGQMGLQHRARLLTPPTPPPLLPGRPEARAGRQGLLGAHAAALCRHARPRAGAGGAAAPGRRHGAARPTRRLHRCTAGGGAAARHSSSHCMLGRLPAVHGRAYASLCCRASGCRSTPPSGGRGAVRGGLPPGGTGGARGRHQQQGAHAALAGAAQGWPCCALLGQVFTAGSQRLQYGWPACRPAYPPLPCNCPCLLQGPANIEAICLLVELGADVEGMLAARPLETPLHIAARSGRGDIIERLLKCPQVRSPGQQRRDLRGPQCGAIAWGGGSMCADPCCPPSLRPRPRPRSPPHAAPRTAPLRCTMAPRLGRRTFWRRWWPRGAL